MEEQWAAQEMHGVRVPTARQVDSVTAIVARLADSPGVSFSSAVGHAGRQAAHILASTPNVHPGDLLRGHVAQTAQRCLGHAVVVVASDTTSFNFSTHQATEGLGPINDNPHSRGFFMHSALAVTTEGLPLGLLHAAMWTRDLAELGKAKTRRSRDNTQKESHKWAEALAAVEAALDAQQHVVLVQDREADVFAFLAEPRREKTQLVVRAAHPRAVEVPGGSMVAAGKRLTLFEAAAQATLFGRIRRMVPRKPDKPEREVALDVYVTPVDIQPARHGRPTDPKEVQRYWVVRATEVDVPEGEDPIEWVLLTTATVSDLESAGRIVQYYTLRWMVERLHYTLKSGCKVERLQVDEAHALMNTVALYLPVAWKTMSVTYLSRTNPDQPASTILCTDEIVVLTAKERREITTVHEALIAIAKLGGYEYYRNAKVPGVKTVWLGIRRLESMVAGWRLATDMQGAILQANDCVKQD